MYSSSARKPERCKVVVRNLPPALAQDDFMQALRQASDQYDWTSFVPGKISSKRTRPACCYIHFKTHTDVLAFKTAFSKRTFAIGSVQQQCVVEYAPFQKMPPSRTKRDPRENTIDADADYAAFVAGINEEREVLPSAEVQLERQAAAAAGEATEGKQVIITPLMQFLAEKHALKQPAAKAAAARAAGAARGSGAQRKGGAAATRLRSTGLAPVAEIEENVMTAAAPASAATKAVAVKAAGASSDPRSAAKAAALRALGKGADGSSTEAAAPRTPTQAAERATAAPDPKVRPGYGAWAPRTVGRLAQQPSAEERPASAAGGDSATVSDRGTAGKAAVAKGARAVASKAVAAGSVSKAADDEGFVDQSAAAAKEARAAASRAAASKAVNRRGRAGKNLDTG